MHCMLVGNFGVGNLGDEALKDYFLQTFSDIEWTVVSAHPAEENEVPRLPGGLRSLLSLRWISTLSAYRKCDAVVFGGGSLFTDAESAYACVLWWVHAAAARFFRKPVHLAFQGIGPFRTCIAAALCRHVAVQAVTVSVRDEPSAIRVKEWGLSNKCVLSFDPVFSLIKNKKITCRTNNILILIPRLNSTDKFINAAQDFAKSRSWDAVKILSMQPDCDLEQRCCQRLAASIDSPISVTEVRTLDALLTELCSAGLVVTQRYHGALAALSLGKRTLIIPQKTGDKLSSLEIEISNAPGAVEEGVRSLRNGLSDV